MMSSARKQQESSILHAALQRAHQDAQVSYQPSNSLWNSQALQNGELRLDVLTISKPELVVLSALLETKEALKHTLKLSIYKSVEMEDASLKRSSSSRRQKIDIAGTSKVLRVCIEFIAKSKGLIELSFERVQIAVEHLNRLGIALHTTKSTLRSLSLNICPIGDTGFSVLAPHLYSSAIQIMRFDHCALTCSSNMQLEKLIKTQGERMDSLFWNATLRITRREDCEDVKCSILSSGGLVALSVEGNALTGEHLVNVARALGVNHWLIGLNFAHNSLVTSEVRELVSKLMANSLLVVVLLSDNPGFSSKISSVLQSGLDHSTVDLNCLHASVKIALETWQSIRDTNELSADKSPEVKAEVLDDTPRMRYTAEVSKIDVDTEFPPYSSLDVQQERIAASEWGALVRDGPQPSSRHSSRPRSFGGEERPLANTSSSSKSGRAETTRKTARSSSVPLRSPARLSLTSSRIFSVLDRKPEAPRASNQVRKLHSESNSRERRVSRRKSSVTITAADTHVVGKIADAVGAITANLESVSLQLRDVSESLFKTVEVQRSMTMSNSYRNSSSPLLGDTRSHSAGDKSLFAVDHFSPQKSLDEDDDAFLTDMVKLSLHRKIEEFNMR